MGNCIELIEYGTSLEKTIITFIGAGNMAKSLIGGLLSSGFRGQNIRAFDTDPEALNTASSLGPISIHDDSYSATNGARIIVLAVKPQSISQACSSIRACVIKQDSVVVTIAAGITTSFIKEQLQEKCKVVRCMPNTPALVGWGASGLFTADKMNDEEKNLIDSIFSAVGTTFWAETEADIDIITALSGSGPAYFFLFMECLADIACELGLNKETAIALTKQTAAGAAHMTLENNIDLKELRKNVTSPGGTTEKAIEAFLANGFRETVTLALKAAHERALQFSSNRSSN
ncbi:MAG: pyrroline-5-carboxylate reductase [Halieaceae bacterium]|nr:pyrroline-5-carboxylate reductase [Halieaceae bacterium]